MADAQEEKETKKEKNTEPLESEIAKLITVNHQTNVGKVHQCKDAVTECPTSLRKSRRGSGIENRRLGR